jgi:hypothetical protein
MEIEKTVSRLSHGVTPPKPVRDFISNGSKKQGFLSNGVNPDQFPALGCASRYIGKESSTAILAVFARAGSPCYIV